MNNQQQQDHSLWSSYGLGIQDANGALKRELIDLAESQNQIDFAVGWSLHRKIEQEHLDEMPPRAPDRADSNTCLSMYGMCKRDPLFSIVDALSRSLSNLAEQNKLSTGSLVKIQLSVSESSGSEDVLPHGFFFLGVLCKKPLCHVLAKAWGHASDSSDSLCFSMFSRIGHEQRPTFTTSHKVFHDFVRSSSCAATAITGLAVSVFRYNFEEHMWSVQGMKVNTIGSAIEYETNLKESNTRPPKVQTELPFGLKMPVKPRAPRKKPTQSSTKRRKSNISRLDTSHPDEPAPRSSFGLFGIKLDGCSSSASASSTSNKSDDLADDDLANDDLADSDSADDLAEQLAVPTPAAQAEASAVHVAAQDFKEDANRRADLAEEVKQTTGPAGPAFAYSSILGFADGSIAPTGRSICYRCTLRIARGSPRFTYFWDTRRPSRYIHGTCVVPFVEASVASRKDQAISAMQQIKDSQENLPDGVKPCAEYILAELLKF